MFCLSNCYLQVDTAHDYIINDNYTTEENLVLHRTFIEVFPHVVFMTEIPQLCRGLERQSGWKEVTDDCSKSLAFEFVASEIETEESRTVVDVESMWVFDGRYNLQLNEIQLPEGITCSKLISGENYVVMSNIDNVDSNRLVLREDDYITFQSSRIARRVVGRNCG